MYWFFISAPDFVDSVKENQKKFATALLAKAKEICASRGVRSRIQDVLTEVLDCRSRVDALHCTSTRVLFDA